MVIVIPGGAIDVFHPFPFTLVVVAVFDIAAVRVIGPQEAVEFIIFIFYGVPVGVCLGSDVPVLVIDIGGLLPQGIDYLCEQVLFVVLVLSGIVIGIGK